MLLNKWGRCDQLTPAQKNIDAGAKKRGRAVSQQRDPSCRLKAATR